VRVKVQEEVEERGKNHFFFFEKIIERQRRRIDSSSRFVFSPSLSLPVFFTQNPHAPWRPPMTDSTSTRSWSTCR